MMKTVRVPGKWGLPRRVWKREICFNAKLTVISFNKKFHTDTRSWHSFFTSNTTQILLLIFSLLIMLDIKLGVAIGGEGYKTENNCQSF